MVQKRQMRQIAIRNLNLPEQINQTTEFTAAASAHRQPSFSALPVAGISEYAGEPSAATASPYPL